MQTTNQDTSSPPRWRPTHTQHRDDGSGTENVCTCACTVHVHVATHVMWAQKLKKRHTKEISCGKSRRMKMRGQDAKQSAWASGWLWQCWSVMVSPTILVQREQLLSHKNANPRGFSTSTKEKTNLFSLPSSNLTWLERGSWPVTHTIGVKWRTTQLKTSEPKSVTPQARPKDFENDSLCVQCRKIFCWACHETVSWSSIKLYINSQKHKTSKLKLERKEVRQRGIVSTETLWRWTASERWKSFWECLSLPHQSYVISESWCSTIKGEFF